LANELRDRFGPIPPETNRLISLTELQLLARGWQIDDIHLEDRFAVLGYRDAQRIARLADRCGSRLRIVDGRSAYLVLDEKNRHGMDRHSGLMSELKSVLQPDAG